MTGAEIKTFFEGLIDDTLDDTLTYQIMNKAKDIIEGMRDWEMLKKMDASHAASTSAIPLPIDYLRTIAMFVGNVPIYQIPFEQYPLFANSSLRWYLYFGNSSFRLIGPPTGTVSHVYIKQTDEITSTTSPVWPAKFHKLLGLQMATEYFAIDQGERSMTWDDRWTVQKNMLLDSMIDWDVSLQKRAVENAVPLDFESDFPLSMM